MKKILPFTYSVFLISMIFCILNSSREVAGDKKVIAEDNLPGEPLCPPPTAPLGNQCVLEDDVVLEETLELFSDIKLNCQGHKITPIEEGILGDSNSRSTPELGIFLNGVQNIQIQECVIEGFDHGILAINSKVPVELKNDPGALAQLRNKIQNNTIKARFVPLHLTASDNFLLEGNSITWKTRGGAGIFININSAINKIINNTVTGDFAASTQGAVLFPGPTAMGPTGPILPNAQNSNPVFPPPPPAPPSTHAGILVVQVLGPFPHLFNAVIGGELFQFEDTLKGNVILEPNDEGVTADTLVEGNVITFTQQNVTDDGASFSNTLRTTIRNNTIGTNLPGVPNGGTRVGIRAGGIGPTSGNRQFAGTCSLDSSRLCLSDFDCNVPGVDTMSLGTCGNFPATVNPTWYSQDWIVENNTIYGPFNLGIGTSANNPILKNNRIFGPFWPLPLPPPSAPLSPQAGIYLEAQFPIETALVTENTVENCAIGLHLQKAQQGIIATIFGAKITRNDFTGYTTAVSTSNDYGLMSELSVDGKGNYWELTCEGEEAGFDEDKVLRVNGTPNPNVVDSHPYGEPVAGTAEEDLPMTCF